MVVGGKRGARCRGGSSENGEGEVRASSLSHAEGTSRLASCHGGPTRKAVRVARSFRHGHLRNSVGPLTAHLLPRRFVTSSRRGRSPLVRSRQPCWCARET